VTGADTERLRTSFGRRPHAILHPNPDHADAEADKERLVKQEFRIGQIVKGFIALLLMLTLGMPGSALAQAPALHEQFSANSSPYRQKD
jgi:hypothetical protein